MPPDKDQETIYDLSVEIRDLLRQILSALGGSISYDEFVYHRVASTMSNPVPANTKGYVLIDWREPTDTGRTFLLYSLGSDQHDNSYYHWVVDGVEMPFSGEAQVGEIYDPFKLPAPLEVNQHVKLLIDNNNSVAYPNTGTDPADPVPYEGVFTGRWK